MEAVSPVHILGLKLSSGFHPTLWLELLLDQGRQSQGVCYFLLGLGLVPGAARCLSSQGQPQCEPCTLPTSSGSGLRGLWGLRKEEGTVRGGAEEARIGVPVHERIDLQLRIIKRVCRWLLHLPVDPLPHSGVQAHLLGREDGHVVLIDESRLFVHHVLVGFSLQLLAGQPEEHVLLAVLCTQERSEHAAARGAVHELVEGLRPALYLLRARQDTSFTAREGL